MKQDGRYLIKVSRDELGLLKRRRRRKRDIRVIQEKILRYVVSPITEYFIPRRLRIICFLGIIGSYMLFYIEGMSDMPDSDIRGCMLLSMITCAFPLFLSTRYIKEELK